MKIGILTFHSADNFGAVLQCYALQETLRELGNEVDVINYVNTKIGSDSKPMDFHKIVINKYHWGNILRYIRQYPQRRANHKSFKPFRKKWLRVGSCCKANNIPQDYDIYVVGSDQLWSLAYTEGIDPVYWGDFAHPTTSSLYTYAVSCRKEDVLAIPDATLREKMSYFSGISLRESKVAELLKQKGFDVRVDLDPTLVADRKIWDNVTSSVFSQRKYIVYYNLRYTNTALKHAESLASQMGCELINLARGHYTPEEFLSIIKYAQGVVTTSFHGTAFSLIFKRPLLVYKLNDGFDDRCINLLHSLNASYCLKELYEQPEFAKMDYPSINARLSVLRAQSLTYLQAMGNIGK